MILKTLRVTNFRNIESTEITLGKGMNVFCGANAQGKTSLLEALWCFTGAKSFRGAKDAELIKFGSTQAKLELTFTDGGREQECTVFVENGRSAVLNGVEYPNASKLAGTVFAIVFSPNDLNIVTGGPLNRRKFMDTAICQLYPAYIATARRYSRALEQRNGILKSLKYNPLNEEFIADFEKEMAVCGAVISHYRNRYIQTVNEFLPEIYGGISEGKETIRAIYTPAGETEADFLKAYQNARASDMQTLTTSVGPHRDDLEITLNGVSLRSFGSQGQKRSAALALKLAESAVIEKISYKTPVALLDDVFSELDPARQNYILNHIKNRQVVLTCCDLKDAHGLENGRIFQIDGGKATVYGKKG